jgi:hypothetical protein
MPENFVVTPPEFDAPAAYGIGLISVVMAAICVIVYAKGDRNRALKGTIATIAWMGLTAAAAKAGMMARFDVMPPPMMILLACIFALAFVIGLSPLGRMIAKQTSLVTLIGLQMFRFPLELVMHHAANRAIMPPQLTYTGYNFDIITGIGAIILFLALISKIRVPKALIWAWNIYGFYCLLAIAIIAVTTSPMIRAFGDDPANLNTWVLFFPYIWLPAVLVVIALAGHIIITRKLRQPRDNQ